MDTDFEGFVAARAGQLYRSAYLLTTSRHAAEDLVQTTLTKAYAAWPRVQRADDPVAYVHGVLLKAFLSDRRRRSSSELAVARPREHAAPDGDPTERIALMAALRQLAPLDRAVVVLRFWEDRTVADTAHRLGLSPAAVKNRSLRSLRVLRELLSDSFRPTPGSLR